MRYSLLVLVIFQLLLSLTTQPMGVFPSKKIPIKKIKIALVAMGNNQKGDSLCLVTGKDNQNNKALVYNLTTDKLETEHTTKDQILYATITQHGPVLLTKRTINTIQRAFECNMITNKESMILDPSMRSWHTYNRPYGTVIGKLGGCKALVIVDKQFSSHKTIICDKNNKITGTIKHSTLPSVNICPDEKNILLYHTVENKAYISVHNTVGKELVRFNTKKYDLYRPWFHPFKNMINIVRYLYCAKTGQLLHTVLRDEGTIVTDYSKEDRLLSQNKSLKEIPVNRFKGPHIPLYLKVPSDNEWGYSSFVKNGQQVGICWYDKKTKIGTEIHIFDVSFLLKIQLMSKLAKEKYTNLKMSFDTKK